jgi:hypothetical protein
VDNWCKSRTWQPAPVPFPVTPVARRRSVKRGVLRCLDRGDVVDLRAEGQDANLRGCQNADQQFEAIIPITGRRKRIEDLVLISWAVRWQVAIATNVENSARSKYSRLGCLRMRNCEVRQFSLGSSEGLAARYPLPGCAPWNPASLENPLSDLNVIVYTDIVDSSKPDTPEEVLR